MGLCGSRNEDSSTSCRKQGKRDYTSLPSLQNGAAGHVVYLPTSGPLTGAQYKERLSGTDGTQSVYLPRAGFTIRYAFVSQRGYYPDALKKANQDAFCAHTRFAGDPEQAFFGIFDGHGEHGAVCATFARDKVPQNLSSSPLLQPSPEAAFYAAMLNTNSQLHHSELDDSASGSTAITVLLRGRTLYVSNVGDSRAVLAERHGSTIVARDLSSDQTPYRKDECERVRKCGARVLTLDQLEGLKDPTIEHWGTDGDAGGGDPPRLWAACSTYPGTAFTRSIGDNAAERIGVFAEPETVCHPVGSEHPFLVIASDGVFEFMPSQSVVDMVSKFDDPQEACYAVAAESYRLWLKHETRTDDITILVLHLCGLKDAVLHATPASTDGSFSSPLWVPVPMTVSKQVSQDVLPAALSPALAELPCSMWDPLLAFATLGYPQVPQTSSLPPMPSPALPSPPPWQRPAEEPMSAESRALLCQAVGGTLLFAGLDAASRQRVFDVMERRHVQAGEQVFCQGEPGNHFYVVESGTFDVYVQHDIQTAPTLVHTHLVSGAFHAVFGELALFCLKPRADTVLARTQGSLWMVHRDAFQAAVQRGACGVRRPSVVHALRKVVLLSCLNMAQLQLLAEAMEEEVCSAGSCVVRQGDSQNQNFFIIEEGAVSCTPLADPMALSGVPQEVLHVCAGETLGERCLLGLNLPRAANVVVASSTARLLRLSCTRFEALFGPLTACINAKAAWRGSVAVQKQLSAVAQHGRGHAILQPLFHLDDLTPRGLLYSTECAALMLFEAVPGLAGGSAEAGSSDATSRRGELLAVEAGSGDVFTLRVTSMTDVLHQGKQALVLRARAITRSLEASLSVPAVLRTFKDNRVLVEVLDTVGLCTLEELLTQAPLDNESAVFVAASVLLGLEHLHWSQLIFRGLSLHSVLVTEAGQIQLVDFRYARPNEGRAMTLCGHPEYLAPEVVEGRGHDQSCDLWTLGVFIFGLLAGETPFASPADDDLQLYRKILSHQLTFPAGFSPAACSLVMRLLQREPAKRLGHLPGGWAALKQHPWFSAIDWAALQEHRLPVPPTWQARVSQFEGVPCAHFEPRPESADDIAWAKDF